MSKRQRIIARACEANGWKFPKQLTSGVMFYEGQHITIHEFNEVVRFYKGE